MVRANNSEGESIDSNTVNETPATIPGIPQSLIATPGDNQVQLNWTAPGSDGGSSITDYNIYRNGSYLDTVDAGITSYLDTAASNGNDYAYQITAVNAEGEGSPSSQQIASPTGPPSEPRNLTGNLGTNNVTLEWQVPTNDGGSALTNYTVYRSLDPGGPYTEIIVLSVSVTNYTDTGLSNGQTYYYVITANNTQGESIYSNELRVTVADVPSEPQNLQASYGDQQITLTWEVPSYTGGSGLTNYSIYWSSDSGGPYLWLANVTAPGTSYIHTGLTNGDTYYYVVSVSNADGEGPNSNEASEIPRTVPDAPTNLIANYGDQQVDLSWDAPANDGGTALTGFIIYRNGSLHDIVGPAETSYTDTGLTNGWNYVYTVRANNSEGMSTDSNTANATPRTVPEAPQNLSGTPAKDQVSLTWDIPSSDGGVPISNYSIFRSQTSGSYGAPIATVGAGETSYVDSTVSSGETYYYVVRANNSEGESAVSNEITIIPGQAPAPPENVDAVHGNQQVTLTWDAPSDNGGIAIFQYRIYRAPNIGGPYIEIDMVPDTTTSYTDTGLTNGISYFYKITAENTKGESLDSSIVSSVPSTIPLAPENLSATYGNQVINLTWSAPPNNGGAIITGYNIYRNTSAGGPYITPIGSVGPGVTTFNDTLVNNGQTYYYIVRAININGESSDPAEVSETPRTTPDAPTNLVANYGDQEVDLSWDAPAIDGGASLTAFIIYRNGSLHDIVGAGVTTYTDTGLTNGWNYVYVVRANNSEGESIDSNSANATPRTVPDAPTLLFATNGNQSVSLTWNPPADDGGSVIIWYNIYRNGTYIDSV
ncbi:MAG: fibronectin type III domain-containing protein, partial [Candidatus Kariarchaeaceae archaeon]